MGRLTRRLDSLSSLDQWHSHDLGSLTNKLRTVDAKVEAMGAISVRQKDQEIEELWRELEVYKGLLADLTDKQGKFEEALQLLQERASEDLKTSKTSVQFISPEKLEAVTKELQDRVSLVQRSLRLLPKSCKIEWEHSSRRSMPIFASMTATVLRISLRSWMACKED